MGEEKRKPAGFKLVDSCDNCSYYFPTSDDNGTCQVYSYGTHSMGWCKHWVCRTPANPICPFCGKPVDPLYCHIECREKRLALANGERGQEVRRSDEHIDVTLEDRT